MFFYISSPSAARETAWFERRHHTMGDIIPNRPDSESCIQWFQVACHKYTHLWAVGFYLRLKINLICKEFCVNLSVLKC